MVKQGKKDLLADGDDDGEVKLTINKEYASKYTQWREKEELQKLKDRYGEEALLRDENEEESSEDDEDAKDLPKLEKSFFKTLSYLKEKDPRIYDKDTIFFPSQLDKVGESGKEKEKQKKKDEPMFLKDFERKLIVEKGGIYADEDDDDSEKQCAPSPTPVEQQRALKESFKKFLEDSDVEEDADLGNLFKKKIKSTAEIKKEEADYKEWLKGRKDELQDKETESDLKGLHDYWCNPNLPSDEAYLRDYILNKRFMETEDENFAPEYNQVIHDDETNEVIEEQDEFEHKYNFRFEQPDQEFIKQYPRCMELSMRRKDDRRRMKRQEIHERKEAEMTSKREEIKRLKALKKKEIMEKINKIKEVTGNDIDFEDLEDLEDDFDPQKHDQKMQKMFNDEYYGVAEEEKPVFNDVDDFLEIEKWEDWRGDNDADKSNHYNGGSSYDEGTSYNGADPEDPNFNMDCDYDPRAHLQEELLRVSKSKKKQRRKSKLSQALAKEKPIFNPSTTKFEDYFEEYYKLDCEDIIDDIPCRFKYRQTVPNDYGLTVDEILRADVRELNQWCSLKKVVKYKPEHVERNEVKVYKVKAQNEALKRKILPSLYADEQPKDENVGDQNWTESTKTKNKQSRKKRNKTESKESTIEESEQWEEVSANMEDQKDLSKKKKKKKNNVHTEEENKELTQSVLEVGETERKVKKNKKKKQQHLNNSVSLGETEPPISNGKDELNANSNTKTFVKNISSSLKQKKKASKKGGEIMSISKESHVISKAKYKKKKQAQFLKTNKKLNPSNPNIPLSDVRLRAYGINPKKFKNKIKYGNKEGLNY